MLTKKNNVFRVFRMVGVGIIISTGFVHVFLPSVHLFEEDCFPSLFKSYEAWPAVFALVGYLGAHLIHISGSVTHSHDFNKTEIDVEHALLNEKASALSLEFGIAVHSVLIGLTLGITSEEFIPLLIAICFHQLFEGLALSSVLFEVPFRKSWIALALVMIYVFSTPFGVAIGIIIRSGVSGDVTAINGTQGILDGISAGILIYNATANLLAPHFVSAEYLDSSINRKIWDVVCIWIGALIMAVIGNWA